MQLSNGLSDPVGLWLGHLLFDSMFAVVVASVIVIVFAAASNQFHGLGFFVRYFFLFCEGYWVRCLLDAYSGWYWSSTASSARFSRIACP